MNNRGADKIISVYWFAVLFIVAAAVVYMVSAFYGQPYDAREIEVDLLLDKVADCVSYGGYMVEGWNEITNENFLGYCGLNLEVEDVYGWNDDQHYVELSIKNFEDVGTPDLVFVNAGYANLKDFCIEGASGGASPVCVKRSFYSIDEQGNKYLIEITGSVRKTEKND